MPAAIIAIRARGFSKSAKFDRGRFRFGVIQRNQRRSFLLNFPQNVVLKSMGVNKPQIHRKRKYVADGAGLYSPMSSGYLNLVLFSNADAPVWLMAFPHIGRHSIAKTAHKRESHNSARPG